MARKNGRKKIEPAVQTMSFVLPAGSPAVNTIDLSQCASLMNRRFYRQGINWAVAGFRVISPSGVTGSLSVTKLPNTWIMSNAWEKSFRVWQTMIKNAQDDSEMKSIQGKFLDFKIFANATHHNAGVGANLLPIDGAANVYSPGQWQMSDIAIPAIGGASVSDYEFIAVGPNDPGVGASGKNAKSVIQGYADSRALPSPEDPNVPDDASLNWMSALFREGNLQDNAVIGMLEGTGTNPPYPFEGDEAGTADTMYPGGETQSPALEYHDSAFITGTTIGGITPMRGSNFPCGLVQIGHNLTEPAAGAVLLQIDLVPGHHRGYLCEPMTEM